ncbi:MAG: polyamine ABC transporter substrate-binding protein [Halioglobus sp.]
MRTGLKILTALGSALLSLSTLAAEPPVLNIYNWSDYIDPDALKEFEQEYGINVNYDIYDSSEMVDTKLLTGGTGYDLVVHSSGFSARLSAIGVYQPIDRSALSNWQHIDKDIIKKIERNYKQPLLGMPYMWGTTGLTYNVDMIRERMPNAPVDSLDLIFDPEIAAKFADCGISFLDDPTTVIPFAMLYLGYPPASVEPEHLAEAEQLLKGVRPYIKYFSSTKMLLDLPSKEVCIAMTWSGDYSVAISRAAEAGLDINLAYSVPIEGSIDWYDVIYIPSDARHIDNAHLFLNFMLRPEIIARTTDYVGYANANLTATPLVDPAITSDIGIYPDAETRKRLFPSIILGPKLERRRSRTWTKIKSGL